MPKRAGYTFHAGSADPSNPRGYFVNTDRRRYDFQTPIAPGAPKPRGLVFETVDPLYDKTIDPTAHRTLIAYDKYQFLPEKVTDAAGLSMQAVYDYRLFQPREVIDPNENKSAFTFTPLGLLESSFIRGKDLTEGDGDRPSVRMEYRFLAFEESPPENRQPIYVRTIRQIHHDTEQDVEPASQIDETITMVEYSDGFGRLLQTRTQGEEVRFGDEYFGGGESILPAKQRGGAGGDVVGTKNTDALNPNVVVSGWQVYDNKGQVVQKYEPFFSEGWDYGRPEDKQFGQKVTMFYDPRGQAIRTLNPDGSEQRVIYGVPDTIAAPDLTKPDDFEPTPWEAYTYDANDNAGRTHPVESASYQHCWDTPASILIDALGRTIKAVERNHEPGTAPGSPVQEIVTLTTYDIRGNVLTITDAREREAFKLVYDYANRKLCLDSIDAGLRLTVLDALGGVIEQRDGKDALTLHAYDNLNRPIRLWARDGNGQNLTLRERLEYGDGGRPDQTGADRANNRAANRLGKPFKYYDEAGLLEFERYDFKGNLLEKTRRVVSDAAILGVFNPPPPGWQVEAFRVDWDNPASTPLDAHAYASTLSYDALNRVKVMTYPEDVENQRRKLVPHYNRAGTLESVVLERTGAGGAPLSETLVERIAYNAKGQRVLIAYGNKIMTRHAYDPHTFRLTHLRTESFNNPNDLTYRHTGTLLQDFGYDYDLVGNILGIHDRTPESGINGSVAGIDQLDRKFTYDAIYRLRSATGRECDRPPDVPWDDKHRCTDLTRTRSYTEEYFYDLVGNIEQLKHRSNGAGFTRKFDLAADNNQLSKLSIGATDFDYRYDANGNMTEESTSRHFEWDWADRMKVFRTQAGGSEPSVHAHYLYDSGGQRVKKLVRKKNLIEVSVYIDGVFEYQRIEQGATVEHNNTLHVMDNQSRIALVRVGNAFANDTTPGVKYHLGDHLGSSILVIDDSGNWLNREEYSPYGETSFGSFARKRYRFGGKERDEESGLYYHGARYYEPWLGKWVSCDPLGAVDDLNLYQAFRSNPVGLSDPNGTDTESPNQTTAETQVTGTVDWYKWNVTKSEVTSEVTDDGTQTIGVTDYGYVEEVHEPVVSNPKRVAEAEDRGRITSATVKQFGKSVADPVGRWALEKILGPLCGPLVTPLLPKAEVDPKEGGADLIGTAVGIGFTAGVESAAPVPSVKGVSGAKTVSGASKVASTFRRAGSAMKAAIKAPAFAFVGNVGIGSGVGGSGKVRQTFITYVFKNNKGIRYVGRAKGCGTPNQVLASRLRKNHHVWEAFAEAEDLEVEVLAVHSNEEASMGAEAFYHDKFKAEGHNLLNSPKSPPLSLDPRKIDKTFSRILAFIRGD